jgi:uncharacterized membrane protein
VFLILRGCGVFLLFSVFVFFVVFSFLRQEFSSGFVGFGTSCSSSPQCISPYLAVLGKVLFMG